MSTSGSTTRSQRVVRTTVAVALIVVACAQAAAAGGAPGPGAYWSRESSLVINGEYIPLVGDFDNSGVDDIYWYAPGVARDYMWHGRGDGLKAGTFLEMTSPQVKGTYIPLVGDFYGDEADDIFWYAPGPAPDVVWVMYQGYIRPVAQEAQVVNGYYRPVVLHEGEPDTFVKDAIAWVDDSTWVRIWSFDHPDPPHASLAPAPAHRTPLVGDFDANGREDLFWPGEGQATDYVTWRTGTSEALTEATSSVVKRYRPVVGQLDGDAGDDILWQQSPYDPDTPASLTSAPVWFGQTDRTFDRTTVASTTGHAILLPGPTEDALDEVLLVSGPADDQVWRAPGRTVTIAPTGNAKYPGLPTHPLVGYFQFQAGVGLLAYGFGTRPDRLYHHLPPSPGTG